MQLLVVRLISLARANFDGGNYIEGRGCGNLGVRIGRRLLVVEVITFVVVGKKMVVKVVLVKDWVAEILVVLAVVVLLVTNG